MGKYSTNTSLSFSSSSSSSIVDAKDVSGTAVTIKFLCSYGGKILPRYPDGKLRYFGGENRVLAVDRCLSLTELLAKMGELCGWGSQVTLRCQLPTEDLDALVSITSDEDLTYLTEEYDIANRDRSVSPLKIRAFLHIPSMITSPPISASSSPPSSVKEKYPILTRRFSPPSSARIPCRNQHPRCQYQYQVYDYQYPHHCTTCSTDGDHGASSERYQHHVQLGNHWQ